MLDEWTRARTPLQWARTEINLGHTLGPLGARESGTAPLEEAVAAYREALQEHTRKRVPLYWAMTAGHQGIALMLLAERRGDAEMAKLAVQQIEAAVTASLDVAMRKRLPILKHDCQKPARLPGSSPSAEGSTRRKG